MPKLKVYKNNKFTNQGPDVVLTKHFMDRVRERRNELKGKSEFEIRKRLNHEVKNSILISIDNNQEHRNFNGHIFACKRDKGKLIAITYLNSKTVRKVNEFYKPRKAC
jgi:hypothetical protein